VGGGGEGDFKHSSPKTGEKRKFFFSLLEGEKNCVETFLRESEKISGRCGGVVATPRKFFLRAKNVWVKRF